MKNFEDIERRDDRNCWSMVHFPLLNTEIYILIKFYFWIFFCFCYFSILNFSFVFCQKLPRHQCFNQIISPQKHFQYLYFDYKMQRKIISTDFSASVSSSPQTDTLQLSREGTKMKHRRSATLPYLYKGGSGLIMYQNRQCSH